jgi:GNAT superfamily N-acetyltransferase
MRYREAGRTDASAIAAVHADSWRVAYRGALSDAFLDGDVLRDRLTVWEQRLAVPREDQLVVVAEDDAGIAGFACVYGADDPRWGTLLDNLHVRRERHQSGIGTRLIREAASWCRARYPTMGLYLWVVEQNAGARRFYERLGMSDREGDEWIPPGGGLVRRRRYAWSRDDLIVLLRRLA